MFFDNPAFFEYVDLWWLLRPNHLHEKGSYIHPLVMMQSLMLIDNLRQTSTFQVNTYGISSKVNMTMKDFEIYQSFLCLVPPGSTSFLCFWKICLGKKTIPLWLNNNKFCVFGDPQTTMTKTRGTQIRTTSKVHKQV